MFAAFKRSYVVFHKHGAAMLLRSRSRALGAAAIAILALLNITLRWKRIGLAANPELLATSAGPKIIVFWHGCQIFMAFAARHALGSASGVPIPRICTLISGHSDGRIVAFATKLLGLESVSGSSTRGGRLAVSNLIERLEGGSHICITPDGPKGPRHCAKEGAITIASKTGVPIWPSACAASKSWVFGSWDKMFLPKPFARIALYFGEPLSIPKDLNEDEIAPFIVELERRILDATRIAEEAVV